MLLGAGEGGGESYGSLVVSMCASRSAPRTAIGNKLVKLPGELSIYPDRRMHGGFSSATHYLCELRATMGTSEAALISPPFVCTLVAVNLLTRYSIPIHTEDSTKLVGDSKVKVPIGS